jgi:Ca2+/H+ antiporter
MLTVNFFIIFKSYGAVLHAFAGNFVELVISSYALMDKQYAIVRSSVLGAILCNILLVSFKRKP